MCLKSIGFSCSIELGIIRLVTKSHAAQISSHSCRDGMENGVVPLDDRICLSPATVRPGALRSGNMKGGRSRSQREYWFWLSTQRWIGRRLAFVKRV